MLFRFPVLAIVVLLLAASYFLIHFRNLPFVACFKRPTWLPWLLSAILTGICIYLTRSIFSFSAIIIQFLIYSLVVTDLLNFIFRMCIKGETASKKWTRLYHSGILAVVFTLIIAGISYFAATHVVTTQYDLKTNKALGKPDLKISMISDVHLGTTMNIEELAKYCNQIQNSNPDIVVLVGDVFDSNTTKGYVEAASRLFGQIKSTYGVYYVFGNHDAGKYSADQYFSKKDIVTNLTSNHVTVLDDNVKLINNEFYMIGRKDASFSRTANRKTLEELLKGLDTSKFILLLDHQPLELEKAAKDGIDLELSGHTHGGQIWPSRLISELFHSNELVYGRKSIDNYQVVVSSGIGAWSYPFKLGSKAEIVQIQLHSN